MFTQDFDFRRILSKEFGYAKNLILLQENQLIFNLLLFILPVSIVLWIPGVWVCFFSLIILNNTLPCKTINYLAIVKEYYFAKPNSYILLIYFAYFVISLLSIFLLNSHLKAIDNAFIFLLWLAISPMLVTFPIDSKALGFGCLAALIIALLIAINQFYFFGINRPYGMYRDDGLSGSGAIKFGDISILLGILSIILLSDNQLKKYGILGGLFGFIVCLYSGSRGGLFAVFLAMIVWLCHFNKKKSSLRLTLSYILLGSIGLIVFDVLMNHVLLVRINETIAELLSILNNNLDTSIGIRLQLWKSALIMFENNYILGVGLNNFGHELLILNKVHLVSDMATHYKHAHNEYLCALATGGIIGFTLTGLLFIIPIAIFKKDYHETVWAKAGFWSVCLMSFFALTDCMFDRRMTVIAFALFISVCMAGNIAEKNNIT